jgi:hypothetical protein
MFCAACTTPGEHTRTTGTDSKAAANSALGTYEKFFSAFRTDNHEEVVGQFAPQGQFQFWGTQSTELITSTAGVRQYFRDALTSARGEVKATLLERSAVPLSDELVLLSGKWQVERTQDGKTVTGNPFRNTVVLQRRGDRWLITQFHNSPMPKPVPKAPAAPK